VLLQKISCKEEAKTRRLSEVFVRGMYLKTRWYAKRNPKENCGLSVGKT